MNSDATLFCSPMHNDPLLTETNRYHLIRRKTVKTREVFGTILEIPYILFNCPFVTTSCTFSAYTSIGRHVQKTHYILDYLD